MFIKMWISYANSNFIKYAYFMGFLLYIKNNYPQVIHKLYTICGFNYVNKSYVYKYVDNLDIVFVNF